MSRYLIQSSVNHAFLHSCPVTGDIAWTHSLLTAVSYGLIRDEEQLAQITEDHCDRGRYSVIDLDNLPECQV